MYGGRGAEQAPVDELFHSPAHPYTRGLLDSLPRLDDPDDAPLRAIPGSPPSPAEPRAGCPFEPRCPRAAAATVPERARCAGESPRPGEVPGGGRLVACHLPLPAAPHPGPYDGAPVPAEEAR